ncbi:MAG: ribonuclease HII [Clostridia bacterium]
MVDFSYELEAINNGYKIICGIDEAGRGPLAGDVYAAAVVLPLDTSIEGLNDSKKLTEKKRDTLYDIIINKATAYCVATATPKEIDDINILNATFLAMKRAVDGLNIKADFALVDGNRIKGLDINSKCIIKGDGISNSIAAASILAKVSRDRSMIELSKKHPDYLFEQHKGYPTKKHYEMIKKYGVIDEIYRKSFLKNLGTK